MASQRKVGTSGDLATRVLRFLTANWLSVILAIVPPLILWWVLQRESFSLTVTILNDLPVVSIDQHYGGDIRVLYRGRAVKSLRALELEVRNSGNRPLERSAFDAPLRFRFAADEVTLPQLVSTAPLGLRPALRRDSSAIITLQPMLLNPGDRFVFTTLSLNSNPSHLGVDVSGRLRGVKEVELRSASESTTPWPAVLSVVGAVLVLVLSGISAARLAKEVVGLTLQFPFGLVLDLTKLIESRFDTAQQVRGLAEQLQIARHDRKANLILLRIKIESLLRELALKADLPRADQLRSIGHLAQKLEERGVLPHEIAAAIRDISPSFNRELHTIETYLSSSEYDALQALALNVIAALNTQLKRLPVGVA